MKATNLNNSVQPGNQAFTTLPYETFSNRLYLLTTRLKNILKKTDSVVDYAALNGHADYLSDSADKLIARLESATKQLELITPDYSHDVMVTVRLEQDS